MKMYENDIPKYLRHEKLKCVFLGGCIKRGEGSSFRAKAHAHIIGEHKGTICYRSAKRLHQKKLGLHELAHIISECGHTEKWRKVCKDLGVSIKSGKGLKGYEKRIQN